MASINIKTAKKVIPMIYAYSTPEIARHNGWTKIGYTESQDVTKRITQQTGTADVQFVEEWRGNAIFEDGSGECFKDIDFHKYLETKLNIEREPGKEWFHIDGNTSKNHFRDFRENRGILKTLDEVITYSLRDEQQEAVTNTVNYLNNSGKTEFLWNCKPRFGKTLSAYDFIKKIKAHNVLIVTNRPAIADSWYNDYVQFVGTDDDYYFVSPTDALRGKKYVLQINDLYTKRERRSDPENVHLIEFISLQDLKGSLYFGGKYDKLKDIRDTDWDLLIVDEAHEGVDTYKTDTAFDRVKRKFTLHLSGTPFKALANEKFEEQAIYNWTYADEQKRKENWNSSDPNPYEILPKLNLLTYQMSEIVKDELEKGISINDEVEEYAFDLNEFFKTNDNGAFVHGKSVDKFLDALTTQEKFPFSTDELRNELKHTFWLLNRVDSAKALAKKLQVHPVFKDYQIVVAAGDGKLDDEKATYDSLNRVKYCIRNYDKTITLSVGQLTTGVTVPEWTAVLMLCNMSSPSLYMQAAFRSQNPCLFKENNGGFLRKENAYVFDFDPARTLIIYEEFANDLSARTTNGKGSSEERKENVRELLNFFPVIGEDEEGKMVELDAASVLSIPRKIKSTEVVRKGFMSNFLFQNISNIFNAPQQVLEILQKFQPVAEPKNKGKIDGTNEVSVDENGDVQIDETFVIGRTTDLFGEKIYDQVDELVTNAMNDIVNVPNSDPLDSLKEMFKDGTVKAIQNVIEKNYGDELHKAELRSIERTLNADADYQINKLSNDLNIERKTIEQEYKNEVENLLFTGKTFDEVEEEKEKKLEELNDKFVEALKEAATEFTKEASKTAVENAEKKIKEHKKDSIEDKVRDHLRGFSRTIPSFLMAYGTEDVTLDNFDDIIPENVFLEVTGITAQEFRFLRDGGEYVNDEGIRAIYPGHLFEPVVFNDSVKEFMALRRKLANYFDDSVEEDIFDYIPPQKTNQIYTPKKVVKMMVDMLEEENPGCFDREDETFADLYMKSGLYIAEVVKRLYRSNAMKFKYPDKHDRLKHIFEHQVYGLAPTEIIYNIAKNFVLGFDETLEITNHNLRLCDSVPYAEEGTLDQKLDELFGGNK